MKTYHIAGLAVVLGFAAMALIFTAGYIAGFFGLTATVYTEYALIGAIIAGIGLLVAALVVDTRERSSSRGVVALPGSGPGLSHPRRWRRSGRVGKMTVGHGIWLFVSLLLAVLVAIGVAGYEAYWGGADIVSATVLGFFVFLLLLVLVIIVFVAMIAVHRRPH